MERRRSLAYALITAALVVLGLLLTRAASSFVPSLSFEFFTNRLTYLYVFLATAVVFLGLGYALGRRIDELRRLSLTDPLTGLANRRAFQIRLQDEWHRAHRYISPLSLLLIDIDGLKRINDARGHAAGDQVLRTAARAIDAAMRSSDFGARWGGDEFTILAPHTDRAAAQQLAHRLTGRLSEQARSDEAAVTLSVGVATTDPRSEPYATVEHLLRDADAALYQAKSDGRNRVKVA
jgi:diguanylate cyclase (GGDEF)-like protein